MKNNNDWVECPEDDDFNELPESCPNCGETYDEVDFEYQICHLCGFNNNPTPKQ